MEIQITPFYMVLSKEIKDKRDNRGNKQNLTFIILLVILAIKSGCVSVSRIHRFMKNHYLQLIFAITIVTIRKFDFK